ncbi:DMT family transporter [Romboutsia sp. Marseille-P6047]|uniref:DMT family transporter n=2 Tax=unclassified Romboutsia TaxID=2626894 RepID=UPI000F06EAA7|nr:MULTISPECIES: DMT family transporter [unclassified Romboutsia]
MISNLRMKGITLVMLGAMLWGISGTVAQFLFQQNGFTPEWLVVVRLLASGILLLFLGLIKKDKGIKEIWKNKKDRTNLISFSILGMLGVQYTYFAAIKHGNAATATILQYLSPVIITCYMAFRCKRLPKLNEVFAIGLAMIGVFFIITKGDIHSLSISELALFWGLASAFASALYTLQPIELLKKYSSTTIVGWGMLIGGIAFSFINPPWKFSGVVSIYSIVGVVFVVVFGTLIAFQCYLESLKYILPTEASTLGSVEPLSAAFLSVIWLKDPFGFMDFLGMTCIIVTIIILSYVKKGNKDEISENSLLDTKL